MKEPSRGSLFSKHCPNLSHYLKDQKVKYRGKYKLGVFSSSKQWNHWSNLSSNLKDYLTQWKALDQYQALDQAED